MRRPALLVATVLAMALAGCGGTGAVTTDAGADLLEARALDYAVSARRALADTRFEGLGDRWLAGLVLEICRDLPDSTDPDTLMAGLLGAVDAPPGSAGDDGILAEVVAAGLAAVCPEAVLEVADTSPADATGAFLAAALPEMEAAGLGDRWGRDDLLAAGSAVCGVLDGGGTPEAAVLAEIAVLFGVTGDSVAGLSGAGLLDAAQGRGVGAVLASAAAFLCPEHRGAVRGYVAGLEG